MGNIRETGRYTTIRKIILYLINTKMKKQKEIFIITESNPNMKDPFTWCTLLKSTLFENEEECDRFAENLIENYIDLYVECGNDYPLYDNFNDSKNNFYVDKNTWYLERGNITVKKSIWNFNS